MTPLTAYAENGMVILIHEGGAEHWAISDN